MSPSASFAAKGHAKLDEMSLERWAKLREVERYQLNIAEKYYRDQDWKVAADEYESYLVKYELGEGGSYAHFKWSLCQVKLERLNTAVKDGFQGVIDNWPDSPEAVASAYLIGKTYKEMGDLGPAKEAYAKVTARHGDEMVAILARLDLADIARIELDRPRRITLLKELVFNAPRAGDAGRQIEEASKTLASLLFSEGLFSEGKDSLATSYKEPTLAGQVNDYVREPIARLVTQADTKDRGLKTADAAIAYFREQMPSPPTNDDETKRVKALTYAVAEVHGAAGRVDEAGKIFERMLVDYKNQDDVFDRYAGWLKNRGRRDEARSLYLRMKNQIEAQGRIATSWREEGKPLSAIPIYQDLTTRDAARAGSWQWQLGETYREARKYQEAIAVYQLCDNFPQNLQHMALCQRALKQYQEAIGTYQQIVGAYESAAPGAMLQIGVTHGEAGNKEDAIAVLQQVCKRYPRTGESAQAHQFLNNKYGIRNTDGGQAKKK